MSTILREDISIYSQIEGKDYAVAIAIDNYKKHRKLNNATKDTTDFLDLLKEKFGFKKDHTFTRYNEEATRKNVYKLFQYLIETIQPDDNIIIYFSGHGALNEVFNHGYWIPYEAEENAYDEYISNAEIAVFLSGIKSHHTFLIVDSCFSGSLFIQRSTTKSVNRSYLSPSRWGLVSGRLETVDDGIPNTNSPFAVSLMKKLKISNDSLSVGELCNHVVEEVQANNHQVPIGEPLRIKGHNGGQFVFRIPQNEETDWKKAKDENTIEAFESFNKAYPKSIFFEQALDEIYSLEIEDINNKSYLSDALKIQIIEELAKKHQTSKIKILNINLESTPKLFR